MFRAHSFHQDKFSAYPGIKQILEQVKADKAAQKERLETYYDDEKLAELAKKKATINGSNGSA
jgi:homogentisate 1,2-dioxygenase